MIQTNIIGLYTVVYVYGGGYLTQAYPTNFHQFYKRKMLTKNEKIEDFREVTEAEKTALEASDAKWKCPPQSFIDMWREIETLDYDEATGFFSVKVSINGRDFSVRDIKYDEAINMYNRRIKGGAWDGGCQGIKRVNIFPHSYFNPNVTSAGMWCSYNNDIEICMGTPSASNRYIPKAVMQGINYCNKLRAIIGCGDISAKNITLFINLPMLEEANIKITTQGANLSISGAPKLSLESMRFLVDQSVNSCTVTVAQAIMDKLTDENNAEWSQLAADAAAKGIIFQS